MIGEGWVYIFKGRSLNGDTDKNQILYQRKQKEKKTVSFPQNFISEFDFVSNSVFIGLIFGATTQKARVY